MSAVDILLLVLLVLAALWTVMTRSLLRSAIGLAFTSAVLSVLMFQLQSPLAAVFELSVCTGLISVVFIGIISLTQPLTGEQIMRHMKSRLKRFWFLPVILLLVGILLRSIKAPVDFAPSPLETEKDVRSVLWSIRHLDIIGQIFILLAGSFGVRILFREKEQK